MNYFCLQVCTPFHAHISILERDKLSEFMNLCFSKFIRNWEGQYPPINLWNTKVMHIAEDILSEIA